MALSVLVVTAALALGVRGDVGHQSFKAFYCAGTAVRERSDPYRVEPLRSCERGFESKPMPAGYVEPAPLPGYDLAAFALLSVLPPRLAAALVAVALALAAVLSARALADFLPVPSFAALLALAPLTLLNVAYGETAPFALVALCASAYFLSTRRWHIAGCAATLALVQPNVGLPAVLALLFFAPRARAAVLLSAAALGIISLGTLGAAQNVEYFTQVLPRLASAELVAADQYGLSRLLYAAGVSATLSLLLAKIWFVCAAALGIAIAGRLAARGGHDFLLPLLPPAAVLLFGIYLHDIQILIALPAAIAIATLAPNGALRAVAATSLAVLTAVWTQPATRTNVIVDAAGVFGALYAVLRDPLAGRRFALAAAGAIAVTACIAAVAHFAPEPSAREIVTRAFTASPDEFSPDAWARYLRATAALTRDTFAPQAAAWLGLAGLLACALATALGRERSSYASAAE
jgi:hypothetical protein